MTEFVSGVHIPTPRKNEKEARKAAKAKAKELQRATETGSVDVVGDPSIRAGMDVTLALGLPGVDGKQYVAKSVVHSFSKSGYVTSIQFEAKV